MKSNTSVQDLVAQLSKSAAGVDGKPGAGTTHDANHQLEPRQADLSGMSQIGPSTACNYVTARQLLRHVAKHYDREMGTVGLRTTQYWLLSQVKTFQPTQSHILVTQLGLDPSTLSRNLKPLLAAGWISVSRGQDARTKFVSLTPAGEIKQHEGFIQWGRAQDRVNTLLGADLVTTLRSLTADCTRLLSDG